MSLRDPVTIARPKKSRATASLGSSLSIHFRASTLVRIYAYILKADSGFAPNPFFGWCTLACCKPAIRRKARPGDWIVGITPRKLDNHLAYAMRMDESLTFEEYWSDRRFRSKRPRWRKGAPIVDKCGDNCYAPIGDGDFRQLRSQHWDHKNDREDKRGMAHDLNGERVLVAKRFCYYGGDAVPFPAHVAFQPPARFNRVNFTDEEKSALLDFLKARPQGIRGQPRHWPTDDTSWQPGKTRCG